jgi:uncharacterized protein YndB with AHSA1/START domain
MDAMTADARMPTDREIVITRLIDAPQELVFDAWTDPEQVGQWWGPSGFTTTTHKMEVKPGGVWRFVMHGPDGRDYQNKITYLEVVPPERLVYRHGGDEDLEPVSFQTTVTFAAEGNKTRVTMRSVFPTAEYRDRVVKEHGAIEGGEQHLARLDEHLAGGGTGTSRAFVISRVFDAPRDLVWKAHSELEGLKHWWGPKGFTWVTGTLDFRPGGMFHYGMRSPNGQGDVGPLRLSRDRQARAYRFGVVLLGRERRPDAPFLEPGMAAGNAEHGDLHRSRRQNHADRQLGRHQRHRA